MPHQRKYVPSHSGGIASQPSRAKRWISAYASHGFSSPLSRSTRWAFVSFTASLITFLRKRKAASSEVPERHFHPGLAARALRAHVAGGRIDLEDGVDGLFSRLSHQPPDSWAESTHCRSGLSSGSDSKGN